MTKEKRNGNQKPHQASSKGLLSQLDGEGMRQMERQQEQQAK